LVLIPCALAAAAPLLPRPSRARSADAAPAAAAPFAWPTEFAWGAGELARRGPSREGSGTLSGFPSEFEGRPLTELPLSGRDRRFADDFPGQVGRFTDGTRELILRHTARATRRLHPASDCLRASGYAIEPLPARPGAAGHVWGCFAARKQADALTVCEQIRDASGRSWPDPSSWYWPALTGASQGPWWSTTIIERQAPPR
jgi:hypothetical protein